ncbi:uncharacterized protein LOC8038825 isoform X1 [Ixodes scapularis]|uniref:Secreted salivary gland peptide, putative n=1 Tax=Ixodes scapularis TaxID=6945 RepID=B7QBN8_IXOSC|nr:uncharacterized protein LOC8038825 isoform X1 [Ixodes scapularis]EEC16260.1 secreted salivary gland peptide, putative [Ixodes scapularis]|eukprot:XP_002412952.1 secreted salivary gland peptide, putative [Ixodes scapularis]
MSRAAFCLLALFAVVAVVSCQRRPYKFNFNPGPSRHRITPYISATGNNRRNFNANAGVRAEYDVARFKNGAKVVGVAEASQDFGRFQGHKYHGKPETGVGLSVEVPIGK